MNSSTIPQIIGNLCAGIAGVLLLVPLQKLLHTYGDKYLNDDGWVPNALYTLIPLWVVLTAAVLCTTATGGFDWLGLGRKSLYPFTAAAALSMGVLMFAFIGLYIRPGFTPRGIYTPFIYLVPLSTLLLVVLSINPRLSSAVPIQWLRLPWTIVASLCLVASVFFLGPRLVRDLPREIGMFAFRIGILGPSTQETLTEIAALDLDDKFDHLLRHAAIHPSRQVREAAADRLRSHPFLARLSSELESGSSEIALEYLLKGTLSPAEQKRLAGPARKAMERWVNRMPASNYTTRKHFKDLRNWGTEVLPPLCEKLANNGVDFSEVLADFRDKAEAKR